MKGKALFLYPNKEGHPGIPNGLSLLSSCLKQNDFDVRIFDTTFFNVLPETLLQRQKHKGIIEVNYEEYWGNRVVKSEKEIKELLEKEIKDYNPNCICVPLTDVNYNFAKYLLKDIKNIAILVGGITATLDPEMVIKDFDNVCIGEGECAIVEFANCVVEGKDYSNIKNVWIRKENNVIKNKLRKFQDLDKNSNQDWSIFDTRHQYKPYMGKFYKTAFVELSRGCHYACSFCCNSQLKETMKECGNYIRLRSVDKFIDEVKELKEKYGIELIFLIDDNFLGVSLNRLKEFCEKYKKEINLPYYIQTRPETITKEKVKLLKYSGISTIAIGIEHGDEKYRKKYLNRKHNNELLKKSFNIVHEFDIRTTANIILGMSYEKEEMTRKTINLMKEIKPKSYSINYYAPYRGTIMRKMAIEQGTITEDYIVENSNEPLNIPDFSKEKIKYYYENFSELLKEKV